MPAPSAAGLSRAFGASKPMAAFRAPAGPSKPKRPLPQAGKVGAPPTQGASQGASSGTAAGTPGAASIEGLSAADFNKHREQASEGSFKSLVSSLRKVPIPADPSGQGFPERRGAGGHPLRSHPAFLRIWQQLKANQSAARTKLSGLQKPHPGKGHAYGRGHGKGPVTR